MSAKLLEFKASERSSRGLVDTKVGGTADIEVGTSGSYRPFDADLLEVSGETSQKNTSDSQPSGLGSGSGDASVTMEWGTSGSVGGVGIAGGRFQSPDDGGTQGKGVKHERDSSPDSSSSSSSDEGDKESAKAKRKKKKKRKGILSGSFLPKFGASKKSSKKDESNRSPLEVGPGVTPPSGNVKPKDWPPNVSAEVQVQAAFDFEGNTRDNQDGGSRPDLEIFSGIGADGQPNTGQSWEEKPLPESSKDDLGQCSQGAGPGSHDPLEVDVACGAALSPEASPPSFVRVTVTASSVDKFPPPEIRPVDEGTDVDTGFTAELDGEYYDPSVETMDTTDLLSQIENTINSIEAAQQQHPGSTFRSELEVNVEPTSSISANINPHSVDIPAVDDLESSSHIHLPEPKDGPILELPEDTQGLAGSNLPDADVDITVPDASVQISSERRSHSPSSSRSSTSEKEEKSKNIFPSLKFHMPKLGGKKSPDKGEDPGNVSIGAAAERNVGSIPSQPDLVVGASDVSLGVDRSQLDVDPMLPDQDQKNDLSLDTSFNITGTSDYSTPGKDVNLGGGLNVNADFDPSSISSNKKDEQERDDSSDIDAYLGGAAVVELPSVDGEKDEVKVSLDAAAKTTSKGKPKKGKIKLPKFKKFGSKKTGGSVDVPKVGAVIDMDVEKPDAGSDVDVEISVSDGPSRPAFEVVGKRASLKRDVDEPNIEMPVSQEVQLVVESKPQGDFEVSLPTVSGGHHTDVGPFTPYGGQENGGNGKVDGKDVSVGLYLDGNVPGGVEVDGPEQHALDVRGASEMDDTSDIEAYLDPPKVATSPAAGHVDVNMSIENPDTSARVKAPYTKGKVYRKGNRNTPKFKSKPNYGVKAGMMSTDIHSPNVTLSSDVDKRGLSGDFEMDVQSPGAEASTEVFLQTPKGDVKASVSEPNLVYNGEAKRKGFTLPRLKMPKFKKKFRKSSKDKTASGSFDAEMGGPVHSGPKISASSSMPDISYGAKGQAEFSGQVSSDFGGPHSPSSPHVDTDEKKKKRWSGSFKFPSFGLPKFGGRKKSQSGSEGHDISSEVDVTFNKPQVKGAPQSKDNSMDIDGNLDVSLGVDTEGKGFKKDDGFEFRVSGDVDNKIEADVDRPSDKIGIGMNIDNDLPNMEGNINFATIEGQNSSFPQPDHDAELELSLNRVINPSANMPSVQMQGVVDTHDFAVNAMEDNVKLPHVSGGMGGSVDPPSDELNVDIPKGQFDIGKGDYDGDISANVDGEIGVPSGGLRIRSDVYTPSGDVEAPGGEFDLDRGVGGNIDMPEVGIKMRGDGDDKSVSSSSSSSSSESDEKKKKKGFFGSLHLPKFGGKGRTKKPKGLEVDVEEGGDIAFEVDKPTGTVDVDVGDMEAGAEVITPEVSVSQKEIKPGFDMDIPEPGVELPDVSGNIDGKVELQSGDVVGDIPSGKIDMNIGDEGVEMSENIDGDIDLPRGDFDIGGGVHAPKGEVDSPSGEVSLDVGVGGNIDVPEVGIKMKGDGDNKSVTSSSSSSSESGEKKKKGFFGSLHLPKFGGKGRTKKSIGTGVSFDHDDDDVRGTLDRPQCDVGMDQGDVNIEAEVAMPEVSVSQKNIKPDIEGTEIPKEKIDIGTGNQAVHISGNVDGDIDLPGADFDISGEIHVPKGEVEAPTGKDGLDVGVGGNIDMPEVGIQMKGDGDNKSVTSSSSRSSENSEKKKKKGFFGSLHLPKFGGKGSPKKSIGTGVSFDRDDDVEVDVDNPQLNIGMDPGDADIGAEVVMPEMSIMPDKMKPDVDVDVSKPSVDLPDASGNVVGRVSLPSGELEVDIPKGKYENDKVDLDVDVSGNADVDLDGAKKDIGISGDIHAPRGDFEAPSGDFEAPSGETDFNVRDGGKIQLPEVGIKMKSDGDDKSLTSSSSSSSTESDEKKKKKGFFGSLHLPKFGGKGRTKKPKGPGIDIEDRGDIAITLDKPTGTVDVDVRGIEAGTEVITPEVSVGQKEIKPGFGVDVPKPVVQLPDVSGNIDGKVDLPSGDVVGDIPKGMVDVDTGNQDVEISGNVDGGIDLPSEDFGMAGDIHSPKGELEAPSREVGLDVGVGGNIDMPEVGIKMKGDGDDKSVSSSSSSSSSESDEKKKKKGFFGSLHLPKFGGRGRMKKSIGTGVSFDQGDDVEIDVDKPHLNVDLDQGNGNGDMDTDLGVLEMSVKPSEMKPDIDVDISRPDISSPNMFSDIEGKVDLPGGNVELNIPTSNIVIDEGDDDVNISGNVDGGINVPMGDLGNGGGIHAPRGDIEAPSGEIGLDVGVGGNTGMPEVGFKLKGDGDDKSVSSSSSSSSENDEKKKKKGLLGSLHLPKFGGKGRTKKPKGPGVDIETGDDIAFSVDKPTGIVDLDKGDIGARAEIVTPEVSVSQKDMKPGIDVDIFKADVDQPDVSGNFGGRVNVPSDGFEVEMPKVKYDMDTGDQDVEIPGNIDGGTDLPLGEIDIEGDINAPRGEIDIPSGEVGLDVGVGGNINMPEVGIKVKRDGDDKSVTSSSSSSSSEVGEKKKKKGFFGSLHLPKFGGKGRTKKHIGTGGSFDRGDDVAVDVDVDKPHLNVAVDGGDAYIGAELGKPEMSITSNNMEPGIDVDISTPDIHSPDVSSDMKGGIDLPSGKLEVDIPKGKVDNEPGDYDVDASGKAEGDIAVQSGGLDIGGNIHTPRGDIEASGGGELDLDVGVGGNIDLPGVGLKMEGDGDDKSISSSSSSSSSESDEKKKKKGFFGSLHLPKFGGKGQTKKPKGLEVDVEEGDDIAFEVDKPTGTVDVDVGDMEAGAEVITPEVSVSQKEIKPGFDMDIPEPGVELPDVSGSIDGKVELPSGDVVGDIPTGKVDVDIGDEDVEISEVIDGDIDLPRGDFNIRGDVHAPKGEDDSPSGEVSLDVGVGGNIDMPEVGIKMKGDGDNKSVTSSSSSSSESGEKKKKGFFGSLHLLKFGGKGRTKKSIGTGVSFDHDDDDVRGTSDRLQGDVGMDQGDVNIEAEVVKPDVSVSQKDIKPDVDVDISELDLPDVSGGVDRGKILPSDDVEVSFPTGKMDIDTGEQEVDMSGNVDEDIDAPRGDSGFGGDINFPRGDFEAPSGQVGLDVGVGGNIDMPGVVMKAKGDGDDKSVTSSSSSSSSESDQKQKKKGFFGSLHLPKFGGKGQTKKHADMKRPEGKINLDLGQVDAGTNADIPDMSVGVNYTKADVDLDVSKPNLEIPDASGSVDAAVEVGREDAEIDAPTGGVDIGVGQGSLDLDKDVVVNLPDAGVHSQKPHSNLGLDGEVKAEVSVRGDVDSDRQDISVSLPRMGVESKGEGDDKSVSSSSSSSEEEIKGKKGLFGGLHLPKLGFANRAKRKSGSLNRGDDVDVNLDGYVNISADPSNVDINPEVSVEVQAGKGDVDVHHPEVDGTFDDLHMHVAAEIPCGDTGSDLKIDQGAPDVDLIIRGASDLKDLKAEGDMDVSQKVDVDVDVPEVNVEGSLQSPNIAQPKVDVNEVEIRSKEQGNLDVDIQGPAEITGPGMNFGLDGKQPDIGVSTTTSPSSSDDEGEKGTPTRKKKKGILPFHLPKIQLKRPKSPEKKKGLSPASVEVELKTDVDVPDTNVAGAVVTGVDVSNGSLDLDQPNIEVSGPEREIELGPQVEEPEMSVSVASSDRPKLNFSALDGVNEPDLDINADVDIGTNLDIGFDGGAKAGMDQDVAVPESDVRIHGANSADVSGDDINFEKFGKMLGEASFGDLDMGDSLEVHIGQDQEENVEVEGTVPISQVDKDLHVDFDLNKQLGIELAADEAGDTSLTPSDFNAGIGLSRSSSKSSVTSSSEEEVKPKKSKGFLPSLKFPKLTSSKGPGKEEAPSVDGRPQEIEENIAPSVSVDVESAPPKVETKSQKGKLGFFKKGKGKKGDSPKSPRSDSEVQVNQGPDAIVPSVNVSLESTPPKLQAELEPPSTSSTPGKLDLSGAITAHSMPTTPQPISPSTPHSFSVVVAIDFGTTFSGYAYSFTKEPDDIHVMRKWEGGDPGVVNMKTLTTLLLTPEGEFHSFGFSARDFYHDMNFTEAQKWLYFDKYKLTLHDDQNLNIETELVASNGTRVKALTVFTHTLKFFKDHFLEELMDLSLDDGPIDEGEIRWVLTVPAIWRQPAKQFMRQAAYQAGIASPLMPNQVLIALEPEAASIYIGKLSMKQLMPERMALKRERWLRGSMGKGSDPNMKVIDELKQGSRYLVVDCGGGTVDITVHEWEQDSGTLKELHKASGGTFGSINVDEAFISLMVDIFGSDFIEEFKIKRPAGWVDLLLAFEARKRNANPWKANYLNVSLPFSFIDYYKKFTNGNLTVDKTLAEYNSPDVSWCGEAPGMLRFSQDGMFKLFKPTTDRLLAKLDQVLEKPQLEGISHIFLAGGFAESPLLQHQLREKYKDRLRVVIPQEVGLATLKGAVMYGQNPKAVSVRRTRLTYGVGALNKFDPKLHPEEKKIVKDGNEWCKDVFDVFVYANQSVSGGDKVTRSYAPASSDQEAIKINIYCTEREDCLFITDEAVRKCGTLTIDLRGSYKGPKRRELQLSMQFGDTEVKVDALDVATGKKVEARVDFLNN